MVTQVLRRGRKASWFIVALLTSSCADLQDIPLEVCGNNVVDEGEDCDGPGSEFKPCGQPGAAHECRFVWVNGEECEAGSVKSPDNRCRAPSGYFQVTTTGFALPGRNLVTLDLEGDGSLEVASLVDLLEGPGLAFSNVNTAGAFSLGEPLPSSGYVGLGDLSNDERPDVALSVRFGFEGDGMTVLVSRDGVLDLKLFPDPTIAQDLRFATLAPWLFPNDTFGDDLDLEVLARLTKDGGKVRMCPVDFGCSEENTLSLQNFSLENVVLAHDEVSQLIWTQNSDGFLYLPRETNGNSFFGEIDPQRAPKLTLANASSLTGPALVDLNGDGLNDVAAIGITERNRAGLYVLLGEAPRPGETFPRWETSATNPEQDRLTLWVSDETNPFLSGLQSSRLIAAQINSDGLPDFILDRQILVSKRELMAGDQVREAFRVVDLDQASTAGSALPLAVGDINGDGLDDIVRSDGFTAVLISYGGDLLPLTEVALSADRAITALAIGDFDGDGAGDILAAGPQSNESAPPEKECARDELLIAYGSKVGLPEVPTSIGVLQPVTQLVSGRFWATFDGFGDFAVASRCESSKKVENVVLTGNAFRVEGKPTQLGLMIDAKPTPLFPTHVFLADVVSPETPEPSPHNDVIVLGELGSLGRAAVVYPSTGEADIRFEDATYFLVPRKDGNFGEDVTVHASSGFLALGLSEVEPNDDFSGTRLVGRVLTHDLTSGGNVATELSLPPLVFADTEFPQRPFARLVGYDKDKAGTPRRYVFVYGAEVVVQGDFSSGEFGLVPGVISRSSSVILQRVGSTLSLEESNLADVVDVVVADTFNTGTTGNVYLIDNFGGLNQLGREDPYVGSTFLQATQATAGDFDGDGLIDMLVTDGATGALLSQLPVNP